MAWSLFASMGITELAHFFLPFMTTDPYGYFPGMASVIVLAPLAWWGMAGMIRANQPVPIPEMAGSFVVLAIDGKYSGYITISDEIKEDAKSAVAAMHAANLKTVMLSGDKQSVVDKIAKEIGIDEAFGDLLPEDKVSKVKLLKDAGRHIAFAGDGVNDAPV